MSTLSGNSYTFTELPENVTVGNFTSIAQDCDFMANGRLHLAETNHNCVFTTNNLQPTEATPIIIGHDVWIGKGVKILGPVNIGNGAIIGAYSVIAKDVPDYAVVVGNPQEIKRIRFTAKQIASLDRIGWWNWSFEDFRDRAQYMTNVDEFIKKYDV